ncbi:hypothetical protein SGQ83_10160 [Flavobacterium sp. Fl-318]|uniref:Lipoprotein n=1 Tax=Flavobacterium cupriresistens TaxID=2893885 RepID=A0ABU4RE40_9FLAO|nr:MULTISPECIES: hypothetical protein [unclassified Flavobacterium]MDX6189715.1 hypothetical protein [Flavobacterium sp. Fl-318]UFH40879.1 hypothetical protein LNP23_13795 [Flavobacterium sp. F-323]
MKRNILILVFFLGIIPISCESVDPYYKIDNLTCQAFKDEALTNVVKPIDIISENKVYFKINMSYTYVANIEKSRQWFNFTTSAYAFSKGTPGIDGLKDKLKTIEIFSNNNFNGKPAGTDIKDLFKWHDVQWDGQQKTIDSLVIALNQSSFFIGGNPYFLKLILMGKPNDNLPQTFTFNFVYENGSRQLVSSTDINWV